MPSSLSANCTSGRAPRRRARRMLAWLLLGPAAAPAALGAGGSATDLAVSFTLPADHWSPTDAPADLTGAGSSPATDPIRASGWWYRATGDVSWERRLPPPISEFYSGDIASISYAAVGALGFSATQLVQVRDNDRPSGTIWDRLCIQNPGTAPLQITLFHYLDADAAGTPADDSAVSIASRHLVLTDGAFPGEDVQYRGPAASAWAVGPASGPGSLLALLNDGTPTQLNNAGAPAGPANLAAAYQFNLTVSPNGTLCGQVWFSARVLERHVRGDRNLDNMPDILLQKANGEIRTWDMRRTERYQLVIGPPVPAQWDVVGWADFKGSHDSQRLTRDRVSGEVFLDGQTLLGAPILPLNWHVAATGDFDYDGYADILWRNATSQKLVIWLMNGRQKIGNLIPHPDQAVDANWEVVGTADLQLADGLLDLLWYNQTTGRLVIWTMNGQMQRITGSFTNPASVGNNNWKAVAVADYGRGVNGERSTADILWRNDTSGKLVVWHMDSSGNRTSGVFPSPDAPEDPLAWRVVGPR